MKHLAVFTLILLLSAALVYGQENTTTNNATDNIAALPEEPNLVCQKDQCSNGCVKCGDKVCHDPGFQCIEEITLDKFFPNEVTTGETQLNIVLKNTGTVNLDDIYAIISGDGIAMLDKIPLEKLNVGGRDYVFAKINASKPGNIDVVIKIYVAGNVKFKYVDQLVVAEPLKSAPAEVINTAQLNSDFEQLKQKYRTLEQVYHDKKTQGYPVDLIYDNLRAVFNHITETQSFLLQGDYKKAQTGLGVISANLDDIKEQLSSVQKEKETLRDKFKNNLLFFGSLAAALVSIFTAYKLIQGSIDKKKILELHKKITLRKKGKKKK